MDTIKQENYALLNDDSDLEEYDKSVPTNKKPHANTCLKSGKVIWMEPKWMCQTFFIMILFLSQMALCILVLTKDLEKTASESEKELIQNISFGTNSRLYHKIQTSFDDGSTLKLENGSQLSEEKQMEYGKSEFLNMAPNLLKRVHSLETNLKSIRKVASGQGEEIKTLLSDQQAQSLKYEKALERQFNNMTTALNSLQNRLEEGLDLVFSQISQLRDDVYFIENNLNRTKQERFGVNQTTPKPAKQITGQLLIKPLLTVSQITDVTEKSQTIVQPVSRQKVNHEELYHVAVSFLKSRADFQVFFYGADKDADGYLTYNEIINVLAEEAPNLDLLRHFDNDHDGKYSYIELIRTFLLEDVL